MTGGVIRIEREPLLRPFRQDLDQFATCKKPIETELKGLRDAVAGSAGCELGGKIIQHEPAAHLDLHDLAGAMELPGKGATAVGIPEQKAFVPHEIARVLRPTAAGQIGG